MSKRKTVPVRIAVAVTADGNVGVCPRYPRMKTDKPAIQDAIADLGYYGHECVAICIVTADVPLPPSPQTIKGKVTAGKKGSAKR